MAPAGRPRSPRGSGDLLADEIIAAATELLVAGGSADAVSIRAVAARVGVTPPSIYRHFVDKDALLDAVCAHYYERFAPVMTAAADGVDEPWDRAVAQGLAYIRFALDNDVVFRTMFARVTTAGESSLTDEVLLSSAFTGFVHTVEDLMARGLIDPGDPVPVVISMWSVAHGLACLMVTKPGLPWGEDLAIAEATLRAACAGFAHTR